MSFQPERPYLELTNPDNEVFLISLKEQDIFTIGRHEDVLSNSKIISKT